MESILYNLTHRRYIGAFSLSFKFWLMLTEFSLGTISVLHFLFVFFFHFSKIRFFLCISKKKEHLIVFLNLLKFSLISKFLQATICYLMNGEFVALFYLSSFHLLNVYTIKFRKIIPNEVWIKNIDFNIIYSVLNSK